VQVKLWETVAQTVQFAWLVKSIIVGYCANPTISRSSSSAQWRSNANWTVCATIAG